jgi:hypothetical protein
MSEYRRVLPVNILSEVFPIGESFPQEAPPFHGAKNVSEIAAIPNDESRNLAKAMVELCTKLQLRAIALANEGDIVPLQVDVNRDLVKHVMSESFGINPDEVNFLPVKDKGELTLPNSILSDPDAVSCLRKFARQRSNKILISPFAMDAGVQTLAKEIGVSYGQEWPHNPNPIVPNGKGWQYPLPESGWNLQEANSKAANYDLAKRIDSDWVPEGETANSYEKAGKDVWKMLFEKGLGEVAVKADINVDGMGNLRFKKDPRTGEITVTYGENSERYRPKDIENMAKLVEDRCRKNGIFISEKHPATVQEWENFLFGVTPSVEVYIPPEETGRRPFIINECVQLIENGAFVGSINPDPLAVSMDRLNEIPLSYWRGLGVDRDEYIQKYRKGYLEAWEKQRKLALKFANIKQAEGEVGHRDFDFGIVMEDDGSYHPRMCESNSRRTGTWVADTLGRRVLGNSYMNKGYVLSVDNLSGAAWDKDFKNIHSVFANAGGLFVPQDKTGIILNGHIQNGSKSRLLTTIIAPTMSDLWQKYQLTKEIMANE